jgi:hypothetical protein
MDKRQTMVDKSLHQQKIKTGHHAHKTEGELNKSFQKRQNTSHNQSSIVHYKLLMTTYILFRLRYEKMLKIPTRKSESVNRRTGDTITKRKWAQEQTMIYKTTLNYVGE